MRTGLAVITGTEDRQHAALTRGTHDNTAYLFTLSPKRADPAPGPRPAPELAGYDRLATQRGDPGHTAPRTEESDAAGVLAEVLDRDAEKLSASRTWQQALADADHLAVLHAIWAAESTRAREKRYRGLLMAVLPTGYQQEPGHRATWLWRILRAAELADLDPRQVLANTVGERELIGARDVCAVIDARNSRRAGALVPVPAPPWSAQLPCIADPERRGYAAQVAALMDPRKERIGEDAATSALPWAVTAPWARSPKIRRPGWSGSCGPPRSAPTGSCPATSIPPTQSAPSPPPTPRRCGPPGARPWPSSAPSTGPKCGACPTGGCCTTSRPRVASGRGWKRRLEAGPGLAG